MTISITNPTVLDILQKLTEKTNQPIETVIEILLVTVDTDRVIEFGQQLALEATE